MKLWEKGIPTSKLVEQFTVGDDRSYDRALAKYDVLASIAHAKMLGRQSIISGEESDALVKALEAYLQTVGQEHFHIEDHFEDIHSKIEAYLIETLGETGKKIHTARSRNDQVLTAIHLYCKDKLDEVCDKTHHFARVLLDLASTHASVFMPGYTHMQVAMPSSFGLWFSAYAETLADDLVSLRAVQHLADQNPLGSAAGYGSSFDIDRAFTTKALDFQNIKVNAIAAQMMRGRTELRVVSALGEVAYSLSKLANDICLYMGQDFGFIQFPDHITTGSSIMPHKKNPDVFELIRAKANTLQASRTELSSLLTNLATGYHRDLQLTKPIVMNAFEQLTELLEVFSEVLPEVRVNEALAQHEKYQYIWSVDTLNKWVREGMPFREAYQKMAQSITDQSYAPDTSLKHVHLGSKDQLGLDHIKQKLDSALHNGRLS
jgi:argininosuccinate lyase